MDRRVVGSTKIEVSCSNCGARLLRYPGYTAYYCNNACKAEWQRTQKPATREWLNQKYVVERMDCVQIGALVGRDPKQVWNWLRDYGIPTRPRGSDPRQGFQKGSALRKGVPVSQETRGKLRAARLRDGGVPYLKNGVHYLKGKRGSEVPSWKGGVTPERQAFYSSDEWKAAAVAVWRRDDAKCQRCGLDSRSIPYRHRTFAIHHIVGFANRALRGEPSNLVLLCRPCHLWVHSRRNTEREFLA